MFCVSVGVLAQTTITWLVRDDAISAWAAERAAAYQRIRPDVNVEIIASDGWSYDSKLALLFASGDAPDLFGQWGSSGYVTHAHHGFLQTIDRFIAADGYDLSDFPPSLLNHYRYKGELVGLPVSMANLFMAYNTTLFERSGIEPIPDDWHAPGWTFDDLIDVARKLTVVDPQTNELERWGIYLWPGDLHLWAWLWGGDLFPREAYETGYPTHSLLTSSEVRQGLESIVELYRNGVTGPNEFQQGRTGMVLGAVWDLQAWLGTGVLQEMDFGLGVIPKGTQRTTVVFGDFIFMSSQTKHPEVVWDFMKFLAEPGRNSLAFYTGLTPARISDVYDWVETMYPDVPQEVLQNVVLTSLDVGRPTPGHTIFNWGQLRQPMVEATTLAVAGRSSVEAALLQAHDIVNAILHEMQMEVNAQ